MIGEEAHLKYLALRRSRCSLKEVNDTESFKTSSYLYSLAHDKKKKGRMNNKIEKEVYSHERSKNFKKSFVFGMV